jgi:uncharacterized protein (DUF111 family)
MWLDCSNGITSMKFLDAIARGTDDHRSWAHVRHFMHSEQARQHASAVFEVLAHAEAQAHGVSVDEVHFHEVGRLENLSFVLGIFAALDMLGIEEWYASPPVLGNGKVTCSHGELAVPAPATQRIVDTHGIPIALIDDEPIIGELTTPTGAALLTQAKGFLITAPKDALILRT